MSNKITQQIEGKKELPQRKSIRLNGYDYSQAGLYFITICCQDRIARFGEVVENEMILNEFGQIAFHEWINLTERYSNFELDVFQIMPNHMHGIILLTDVGAGFTPARNTNDKKINADASIDKSMTDDKQATARVAPTVGNMVGAYKSLVANGCLEIYKSKNESMGKFWQRNYYEHIIRNEESYQQISNYILNNPTKWSEDKFYMQ
jgi:REP element-mobilizing transposase RayT